VNRLEQWVLGKKQANKSLIVKQVRVFDKKIRTWWLGKMWQVGKMWWGGRMTSKQNVASIQNMINR